MAFVDSCSNRKGYSELINCVKNKPIPATLSDEVVADIYADGVAVIDVESDDSFGLSWAEIEKLIEIYEEHHGR